MFVGALGSVTAGFAEGVELVADYGRGIVEVVGVVVVIIAVAMEV